MTFAPKSNKQNRIAFIARSTLYSSPGGDTIQIERTADYLGKLGWQVTIFKTNEVIAYNQFDLFHYFNLTRPADMLYHIQKTDKPFFVSPIYLELNEFERKARRGVIGMVTKTLPDSSVEYLKCVGRYVMNGEKIRSWYYLLNGHKSSMNKILRKCAAIFPNSHSEYERIHKAFGYNGPYDIVPCGVDLEIFDLPAKVKRQPNLILCVGRIEARKNQLSLIRALHDTEFDLVIIGNPSPNHKAYYESCKNASNGKVTFIENIDQSDLMDYYQKAKVHVLPSWFETVGLSSLEAAFCGCNIVVSDKGDVKEYFRNNAWYCNPEQTDSILKAITEAATAPADHALQDRIRADYNWHRVAEVMNALYFKHLKL